MQKIPTIVSLIINELKNNATSKCLSFIFNIKLACSRNVTLFLVNSLRTWAAVEAGKDKASVILTLKITV